VQHRHPTPGPAGSGAPVPAAAVLAAAADAQDGVVGLGYLPGELLTHTVLPGDGLDDSGGEAVGVARA
jgi:hypothetical protein